MRSLVILSSFFLIAGCVDDSPQYIQYSKGDFWVDNFRNNNFPSKAYKNDRIYCSSIEIGSGRPNFLYCLNLKTGKVDWATQVKNWASQPPIICDSFIYYCSFIGEIYKFDKNGNQIWLSKFNETYGEHCINPLNNNLIVNTVAYGLREIDCKTGEVIDSIGYSKIDVTLPVFQHDTIYQVISDTLFCRNHTTNIILWKRKTGFNIDRLFLNRQQLYYFDDTQHLYCLNSRTGKLLWQSDSIFPKQPFNPHLEFENGKILNYFSNLDDILVIDITSGKVERSTNYQNLQKENFLMPAIMKYNVTSDKKDYEILVTNTLFGFWDFRKEFDISVNKYSQH